ncbi:NAD(P)-dependent oxidoreductase [Acidovorax sp. NCPPB 4044]|uniref:NAD(P)-dependent oxidoreductase n=1 Tax=Acidovorax sp. NCPPB 4044 TaxID=2940490 RepID=UPI00230468D0|nr:NAD(P)H-binding protein [Acidovorax sp. NCPPB 4044]MDA8519262.1 NAD(P)H-binding protein [Acidovorax sp. NCPPB 4044]
MPSRPPRKVALFGATGKTGRHLIAEGLRRGMDVTVFARPGTAFDHPGVRAISGALTDAARLREAIRGSDAVLSALGPTALRHPGDLPITHAMEAIILAMEQEGVKRLIAVSTGTAADPADGFDWKIRMPAALIRAAMPGAYRDIIGLARTIRASSLDWTMVRVAFLTQRPASGRLNVGLYGATRHSMAVSREAVAAFMFDRIAEPGSIRSAPGISAG